jgi:hypothetical protein
MIRLRKDRAGTCSLGTPNYTWEQDGDVVDVEDHHAVELLRIPDGGFHVVNPPAEPADEDQAESEASLDEAPAAPAQVTEVAEAPLAEAPAPVPAAAKKTAAPRAKAGKTETSAA